MSIKEQNEDEEESSSDVYESHQPDSYFVGSMASSAILQRQTTTHRIKNTRLYEQAMSDLERREMKLNMQRLAQLNREFSEVSLVPTTNYSLNQSLVTEPFEERNERFTVQLREKKDRLKTAID
jgi:hypothetical protein